MIDSKAARSSFFAVVCITALVGCGRMPTISTALPNWPGGSGMTPEETRLKREEEISKYTTPGTSQPAPQAPAPTSASASTAAPARGTRTFDVAPELLVQPPVRQAPQVVASAAGSAPSASRYGDLIFVSGQLPVDARGAPSGARFEDQARLTMENVRSVLESNKLSMANVVSMTVYLKDLNDLNAFDAVFASYFKGAQPARSVVEVARLPSNARIEISAVAGR